MKIVPTVILLYSFLPFDWDYHQIQNAKLEAILFNNQIEY